MPRWGKRVGKWLLGGLLLSILFIIGANVWVVLSTEDKVLTQIDQLQNQDVALVLGTSHLLVDGSPNPFFQNRIYTASLLYKEGKIKHILVSGDNRTRYYNEPAAMRKALMELGIPSEAITLDFAGLRTLDSIVRSKEIFGQNKITIITQPFHSYRALFISRYYGIDAVALVAQEPSQEEKAIKVYLREYLARAKAILDLYVLGTNPKHLGEKEPLQI